MALYSTLVLAGGRVVCPSQHLDAHMDVYVRDGRIECIKPSQAKSHEHGAQVLDVSGCVVMPGAIDLALTFRDPGRETDETFDETVWQAAKGGYTTVVARPEGCPVVDDKVTIAHRYAQAQRAPINVLPSGALTKDMLGEAMAEIGDMASAGACLLVGGGRVTRNLGLLRDAMEYAQSFSKALLLGGAHFQLVRSGVVHEGASATVLGLPGIPEAAEVIAVSAYIELARLVGARVVIGPISSAKSAELICRAQDEGLPIFGLVSMWNLLYDEQDVIERAYDSNLRFDPPLRLSRDKQMLRQCVADGRFAVTPDHQPAAREGKELEFALADPGCSAIAACIPALMTYLPDIPLLALSRSLSELPAHILGRSDIGTLRPGVRADIVVLERRAHMTSIVHSPLSGASFDVSVRYSFINGRLLEEDKALDGCSRISP